MEALRIQAPHGHFFDSPFGPPIRGDRWERSDGGVLVTAEVEPSTVVAVHHPKSRIGYLGNFSVAAMFSSRSPFERMLSHIRQSDLGDELEAWVGGGAPLSRPHPDYYPEDLEIYNETVAYNQERAIERLGLFGVGAIQHDSLDIDEKITGVIFDTANGTVDYGVDHVDLP